MALENCFCASQNSKGEWTVKNTSRRDAKSVHSKRSDAWYEARRLARGAGVDALLVGQNGKVLTRNSYHE